METRWKRRIFSNEPIERFSDDNGGIYVIQKNNEIIFIGESNNLEEKLLIHLSTLKGLKLSFYIRNSVDFNPTKAVNELLQMYLLNHGRLPELNNKYIILNQYS